MKNANVNLEFVMNQRKKTFNKKFKLFMMK